MPITQAPGGTGFEPLQDLGSQILNFLMQKEQLSLQKERLKLEKAESSARSEQASFERAQQEAAILGAQAAATLFSSSLTGTQAQSFQSTIAGLTPEQLPSLLNTLQTLQANQGALVGQGLTQEGQRISNDVAAATAPAAVEASFLANERGRTDLSITQQTRQAVVDAARANADNAQINAQLGRLQLTNDPSRVGQLRALWESGLSLGEAADLSGVNIGDLARDKKFVPASGAGAGGGEAARNAAGYYIGMSASNDLINSLVDGGARLTLLGSVVRGSERAWIQALGNKAVSPEQRQLINAHQNFAENYRRAISGQASADREAVRILNTVAEQTGDDPRTIQQKRFMRSVMINMVQQRMVGSMTPEAAASVILQAAEAQGLDEEKLAIFREQLEDARAFTQATSTPLGTTLQGVSSQPTTIDTLSGSIERADSILSGRFRIN